MRTGACNENMVFHSLEYWDERVGLGDIIGALGDFFCILLSDNFFFLESMEIRAIFLGGRI